MSILFHNYFIIKSKISKYMFRLFIYCFFFQLLFINFSTWFQILKENAQLPKMTLPRKTKVLIDFLTSSQGGVRWPAGSFSCLGGRANQREGAGPAAAAHELSNRFVLDSWADWEHVYGGKTLRENRTSSRTSNVELDWKNPGEFIQKKRPGIMQVWRGWEAPGQVHLLVSVWVSLCLFCLTPCWPFPLSPRYCQL